MKNAWRSLDVGAALIILLTVVAYIPAMRGGFIWDDDDHLTKNPVMLSVHGLKLIWSSPPASRYYPLTLTSFWVQRRLWGLDPLPYHAVNIALQAVNAVLLWTLLRRLRVRGAWVAAALWAVHPVNVESVAWITELKNVQSGLFFLLSVLSFLRFEDTLRRRDYVIALLCGVAAMLSKPSTVMLPAVLLLCAWWRRGRWRREDLMWATPFIIFGLGMSLLTIVEQRHQIGGEVASDWTFTLAQRLVLAGHAVWFYAGKVLWPTNLCFIYPRWELRADSAVAWLPLAGLALVAGTLWHFRRTGWARTTTFGLSYFIILLLPVLGFFGIYFFRYSFVTDHFQYLASMGLIAWAVQVGAEMFQQNRRLRTIAAAIVLLTLGVSTWRQTHVYRDVETLWHDTLAKNPDAWIAHNNLGLLLRDSGNTAEAKEHYEQALRIKPDCAEVHYNLGIILQQTGKMQEATQHWEQAVRINPEHAEAHYNLGLALAQAGKVRQAIGHWQHAVRTRPEYAEAHYNLGVALVGLGRVQEAIEHWEQALRNKPDYADAHYNLGIALEQTGKTEDAIRHYEQALRIKPDYIEAQNGLARLRIAQ